MSTNSSPASEQQKTSRGLNIALWIAQGLLAVGFGLAGFMKVTTSAAELATKINWVTPEQLPLIRFIGASELAGAIGLILPAATRILPKLTAVAAAGLVVIMILAAVFHLSRGEAHSVPVNVLLGGLAGFVAWGRWKKAPIPSRSAG
jgi:putative oxidoreductase